MSNIIQIKTCEFKASGDEVTYGFMIWDGAVQTFDDSFESVQEAYDYIKENMDVIQDYPGFENIDLDRVTIYLDGEIIHDRRNT